MNTKPITGINDDYAVCSYGDYSFYYGYEYSKCGECGEINCKNEDHADADSEWCFVAKFEREEIIIPRKKLGIERFCEPAEALLIGITWLFAKYKLKKRPQFQTNKEWIKDYEHAE